MKNRINANKFRKAAVSAAQESALGSEQLNNDLATFMGHTKATADRYYYMEKKLNAATPAGEKLPIVM